MRGNDLIKFCTKQNFEGFGFQQLVTLCAHGALKSVASFSLAANSNSNFYLAGNLLVSLTLTKCYTDLVMVFKPSQATRQVDSPQEPIKTLFESKDKLP